nr:outer membrane beta-barrel protein [Capnocytophaga canimorsus]
MKIFIGLWFFGTVSSLQAQDMGIAIKGGLNFNTLSVSAKGGANTTGLESKIGYHLGGTYEESITDILFVEIGLLLDTRGYKQIQREDVDRREYSLNLLSLTLPTTLKGKFEVADDIRLFIEGGVHLNFLLSGSKHSKETRDGKILREETSTVSFEGDDAFKRFGFGLTFGGGIEYKNFIFSLGYDLGLRDYDENEDVSVKLNALKIGVAYRF